MRAARRLLAFAAAFLGGPALAQSVSPGEALRCPSGGDLPPAVAWVGRTERWADHGVTGAQADAGLVHLQLQAEGGGNLQGADHAPFEASALVGCEVLADAPPGFDRAAFEAGHAQWLAAVADGAGAFTINPAEALWAVLGIRNGAMGS